MEEILAQQKCGKLWEVLGCDAGGISGPQSDKGLARRDTPVVFFTVFLI